MAYPLEPLSLEQVCQFDKRDEHRDLKEELARLFKLVEPGALKVPDGLQLVGRQVFVVVHASLAPAPR